MRDFLRLTAFEYKKIFKRKSSVVGIIFVIIFSIITCIIPTVGNHYTNGVSTESKYEALMTDKSYAMKLAGRAIDSNLLLEMSEAYSHIPENAENYSSTAEYNTYARPYSEVYRIARSTFSSKSSVFNVEDASSMTYDKADSFYSSREKNMIADMQSYGAGEDEINFMLQKDSEVSKPIVFSYSDTYRSLASFLYTSGVFLVFVIAICIAPIFSSEYAGGTDQLLLTSKYGKNKLIASKLFTGISFSIILSILVIIFQTIIAFAIYGTEGFNSPIQLINALCCYNFTLGQTIIILMAVSVIACIFTASITMALSASLKSPFSVMIIMSLLNFVPMILDFKGSSPYIRVMQKIMMLFPARLCNIWDSFSSYMYNIFGNFIEPYIFLPSFAAVISIVMLMIAHRKFKLRQIR